MRLARMTGGIGFGLLVGLFLLSAFPGLSAPHLAGASSPAGAGLPGAGVAAPASAIQPEAARVASPANPSTSSVARPADTCSGSPNWVSGSTNFFTDVDVCFSVPGNSTPPNIPTVPLTGNISQYVHGFWVNISSNVRIFSANLCLWATGWPIPPLGAQPVAGFDPSQWDTADCRAMVVGTSSGLNPDTAAYFVNCYKYFLPGSNVSFMIEVTSGIGVVRSYQTLNVTESYNTGYTTYPTWELFVQSPFASYNFSNDFQLSTIPSVLTPPTFPPNPTQSVQMVLTSFNQNGGPAPPIPAAFIQGTVITPGLQGTSTPFSVYFGPTNATVMTLDNPIPPQPAGTKVFFNATAFEYWDGLSHIDSVTSETWNFTYSSGGGWPQPNAPLEDNAELSSSPAVFAPGVTSLPTDTPVNISVHEPVENVTFTAAEVDFKFTDHGATTLGSVPMIASSQNTSYVILPGLPAATSVAFSVVVKDVNGDADSSGVYSYTENGTPVPTLPPSQGFFFVEVYDVATNHFVVGANYTVQNLSWFQTAATLPLGFGQLLAGAVTQPTYLYYGTYFVTVHAFGSTVERPVTISASTPYLTITFYVTSSPVTLQTSSPAPALYTAGALVGILAAAVTIIPIRKWFQERRAKAEAEQRRVTL